MRSSAAATETIAKSAAAGRSESRRGIDYHQGRRRKTPLYPPDFHRRHQNCARLQSLENPHMHSARAIEDLQAQGKRRPEWENLYAALKAALQDATVASHAERKS